jgi:chromosome segregation ATPase
MSKTNALFTAGIVTSMVIIALVGLSVYNHRVAAAAEADASNAAYVQALTARQAQLDDALGTMETRRDDYASQLDTATQTIKDLQASIAQLQAHIDENNAKIAEYDPQLTALSNTMWSLAQTRNDLAAKEADYSAQIEAANATIVALKAQLGQ